MPIEIQPPVFVIDGLDVSTHPSIDKVIRQLEGVDVEDGIYKVFDAAGRRITLRAEGVRRTGFMVDIGTVHLDAVETVPSGAAELRELLIEYLRCCHKSVADNADLPAVVTAVCDVNHSP